MGQIEITMLPSEQWQEMNIVKFNYKYLDYPCVATIVYFLPLEQPNCVTDSKIVNETIVESLKNAFGDISVIKKSILFDKVKEDYRKVFDGGRPRVDFIIRMIPEIKWKCRKAKAL